MPFERDGKPFASDAPPAVPKGLVDGATSATLANLHSHADELLVSADKLIRNIVSDALKETFAHVDRTALELRRSAQESIDHVSKATKDALVELDRLVERRIRAVEETSLKRVQLALEETVRASAKPVRRELDELLDAVSRKVVALSIPLSSALLIRRVVSVLGLNQSIAGIVAASLGVVSIVTFVIGAGEFSRRRMTGLAAELVPFALAGLLVGSALAIMG